MISGYIEFLHEIIAFQPMIMILGRSLNIIRLIQGVSEGLMILKNTMIVFFFTFCVLLILGPVCQAQQAHVTIQNVSVELVKTRPPVGGVTIREYTISAVLSNIGDSKSVNITVKFRDPEPGISGNLTLQPESYSLQPNEEKTFIFENWPTTLSGTIILNISFDPSSPNVVHTDDNSGHYLYTLQIGDSQTTTSTPGFEVLIVLVALLVILLKKRIKIQ